MGSFGALAEFMWTPSEFVSLTKTESAIEVTSGRGAMRIYMLPDIRALAYQTLWGDHGEAWTSGVALCLPALATEKKSGFRHLGTDRHSLRPADLDSVLFDLGIGVGHTSMCIRTRDAEILAAAQGMEGEDILSSRGAEFIHLLRKKSPVRVMTSPIGRIEVYSPIPDEGGQSPVGPHTHLLPRLARLRRTHSANIPIPYSLQPVLTLHPRSPWRSVGGERRSYDPSVARDFDEIIAEFGDERAREVSRAIQDAVLSSQQPHSFAFPVDRHLRVQARVALRRMAQEGIEADIAEWLALYD